MTPELAQLRHRAAILRDWQSQESYRIIMEETEQAITQAFEQMLQAKENVDIWQHRGAIIALRQLRALPEHLARMAEYMGRQHAEHN